MGLPKMTVAKDLTTSMGGTIASKTRGLYVLANDKVATWFSAFLRSFRTYNPDLSFCLIPFNEQAEECTRLAFQYGGDVHAPAGRFEELEYIGRKLVLGESTHGAHWFRRFAAFDGPFEDFAYLDCRMAVLADITPFIQSPHQFSVPLVHYDTAIDQVYNDGPTRRSLCRQGLGHGFLSGMWASHSGLFSFSEMETVAQNLVGLRAEMNTRNADQFFLNYLCDSRGIRTCHYADLDARFAHTAWANDRGSIYQDEEGVWRKWDFGGLQHRKRMMFLHWAGIHLTPSMPQFHIHRRFRPSQPCVTQRAKEVVQAVGGSVFRILRSNRRLNTTFHAWRDRQH